MREQITKNQGRYKNIKCTCYTSKIIIKTLKIYSTNEMFQSYFSKSCIHKEKLRKFHITKIYKIEITEIIIRADIPYVYVSI